MRYTYTPVTHTHGNSVVSQWKSEMWNVFFPLLSGCKESSQSWYPVLEENKEQFRKSPNTRITAFTSLILPRLSVEAPLRS